MLTGQIIFDTTTLPEMADPVRMDVVCFIGLLAPRVGVAGAALRAWWERHGYLSASERHGPVSAVGKPVPIGSAAELGAMFDTGARVDRAAEVSGGPLPAVFAVGDLAQPLIVVVDGQLQEIALPAGVSTPADLLVLDHPAIAVRVQETAGEQRLIVARRAGGAGTLSVLAYPALGFAQTAHCTARMVPTMLAAAVQQFFASGGKRAYVLSMGAPLALTAARPERTRALAQIAGLGGVPDAQVLAALAGPVPPPHIPAQDRRGLTHLFGLEDASFLVMPDLPELVATGASLPEEMAVMPPPAAAFQPCVPQMAQAAAPLVLRDMALPQTDARGLMLWQAVVQRALGIIALHRRDMHMIAALPRCSQADMIARFLPDSAFLMLAAPYLQTTVSRDLPGGMMPADTVLAAQIAATLVGRRPFGSAAAHAVQAVYAIAEPVPRPNPNSGWPGAAPVCWFGQGPRGVELARDITASSDSAWRAGPASRLAARLFREAGILGQDLMFEPISPRLMQQVTRAFTATLARVANAGALRSTDSDPGFSVICDSRTISAQDIDAGRLVAEVTFQPAMPIDAIRVFLPIGGGR